MRDAKLFRIGPETVQALPSNSVALEKSLQTLIERHLETLLGVRFVATEHPTGAVHGGRIDTLGLDENNCPVIIEYKRALNENVINQGLFYLNWLMDHRAEFKLLVLEQYGKPTADAIDWSAPRLLCIAGDFTKYDEHAVQQIPRNIELIRYRRYGDDLLLLDVVAATSIETPSTPKSSITKMSASKAASKAFESKGDDTEETYVLQLFSKCSPAVRDRFEALRAYALALGDVQERIVKEYISFRRLKGFANVMFRPQTDRMLVYLNLPPDCVGFEPGFARDMWGMKGWPSTWQLELTIDSDDDLERAKPLILKSYEAS
jgi:predicted transport protein